MIIDTLKASLANHVECALTTQGYHWNVEGVDFKQYHEFFKEIYEDLWAQVDVLAEYVRTLTEGVEYVNPAMEILIKNRTITGSLIVGKKPVDMCKAVRVLNTELLEDYSKIFDEATKEKQQGLANWAADRIDKINNVQWAINVIIKE